MDASPRLHVPLRSEAQARHDRDDAIIAGLLIGLDALCVVATRLQDTAGTERGRLACAAMIEGAETIRRRLLLGEVVT